MSIDEKHPWLCDWRRRCRRREAIKALSGLVASPHDLSVPLVMPAGARLAISHSVGLTQGDVVGSLGSGASWMHPSLMADEIFAGG